MDDKRVDPDVRESIVGKPDADEELKILGEDGFHPGLPQTNTPFRRNVQGEARGSAQLGTIGRGSQTGSEFDVTDED